MQQGIGRTASAAAVARLRDALEQRKMQQQDFAAIVGWSKSRVSRRLNGDREWPLEDAVDVAEFLDITLDELVARDAVLA